MTFSTFLFKTVSFPIETSPAMKNVYLTLFVLVFLVACNDEPINNEVAVLDLPEESYTYITGNEIATLGRVLFYDQQLSINNSISCASCHKQVLAFSDNKKFSRGFDNNLTLRNSMPIQNLASFFNDFNGNISFGSSAGLFWDGRGLNHGTSVLLPIINHIEMGIPDLAFLSDKLSKVEYYPALFENAFFDPQITGERIGFALQAFTHSITSNETKFDLSRRDGEALSAKELAGRELFMNKYDCNTCHRIENSQGYISAGTFANIGLEEVYQDGGVELTSGSSFDNGKFKIPSLRNVILTGPYMHDGRFETLEEVIDHYKSNVADHPNLDFRLKDENGLPKRPQISDNEVQAIIAFLGTMTDHEMINDPKFSNPFKTQ
jgi:cytochrome c peroxidase